MIKPLRAARWQTWGRKGRLSVIHLLKPEDERLTICGNKVEPDTAEYFTAEESGCSSCYVKLNERTFGRRSRGKQHTRETIRVAMDDFIVVRGCAINYQSEERVATNMLVVPQGEHKLALKGAP